MALLSGVYKTAHPNWKHDCVTPLRVRNHPAAVMVNGSPVRELASQGEGCSAATSLLRDHLLNGKHDPESATSQSISLLTSFWYLPCKCTLQFNFLPDGPS